tara:strand:+ start:138 stop:1706 length:1569 start_codon:yes stop_codon:yes gene_type:complete
MKNIKFQNRLITILITFILILGCDPETITDGVVPISDKAAKNLCPIGKPDEYTVQNGKSLEIDFNKGVLSNDEDPGGGAMSASIVVGPQAGTLTLNADGSFTYKHNGSGAGEDNFVYVASNTTCDNTKEPEVSSMAPVIIKITEGGGPTLTSNVFIAGDYTSGGEQFACVFTDENGDGTFETLHLPNSFEAMDLKMHDGKLHVVGSGGPAGDDPMMWVDGVPQTLDYKYSNKNWGAAGATGIDIDTNGDIYISGWFVTQNGIGACQWKNGEFKVLTENADSEAFDIAVKDGKAVAVGWYMSHHKIYAARWVNGVRTKIHSKGDAEAREVMFVGNKYYISGWAYNNWNMNNGGAAMWEGAVKTAKLMKKGKDPILDAVSGWAYTSEGYGMGYDKSTNKFWLAGATDWINIGKWPNIWKYTPGGGNVVYDLLEEPDGSKPGCDVKYVGGSNGIEAYKCEGGEVHDIAVWDGKTYAVGMTTADTTSGNNMWEPQSQIWINGIKYPIRDHRTDGGMSNAYQILVID